MNVKIKKTASIILASLLSIFSLNVNILGVKNNKSNEKDPLLPKRNSIVPDRSSDDSSDGEIDFTATKPIISPESSVETNASSSPDALSEPSAEINTSNKSDTLPESSAETNTLSVQENNPKITYKYVSSYVSFQYNFLKGNTFC